MSHVLAPSARPLKLGGDGNFGPVVQLVPLLVALVVVFTSPVELGCTPIFGATGNCNRLSIATDFDNRNWNRSQPVVSSSVA
jgi:hypothetical protein